MGVLWKLQQSYSSWCDVAYAVVWALPPQARLQLVSTEGLTLLITGWYLGRRNTEMWLTQIGEGEGLVCIVDVSIDMIGLISS